MPALRDTSQPRVLVTGFEAFPGAPVNPTEALVRRLRRKPLNVDGMGPFAAEILPVDYQEIGPRLSEIGRNFQPDIAIHFGLALGTRGFRLERFARNSFASASLDNRGFAPPDGPICAAALRLPSTLPLEAIHGVLSGEGLPVEWSDDAGGYLCNVAFTLSAAGVCDGFSSRMTGFVHIPATGRGQMLHVGDLDRGVRMILKEAVSHWVIQSPR